MNQLLVTYFPAIVQFFVTFIYFFIESLLHYHIGKFGKLGLAFPKSNELIMIVVTILIITGLATITTKIINAISCLNSKTHEIKKYVNNIFHNYIKILY